VKKDPPVRPECAQCGKLRTRPPKSYATRVQYDREPFCSRECCQEWHGVVPGKTVCTIHYYEAAA
jgi:hypothetical protein